MDAMTWPWIGLLFLGALHGVNPAMGWLFAVGLGLQQQDRAAVLRAIGPLALGHLLAIAVTLAVAMAMGRVLSGDVLRWTIAAALVGMGVLHLTRRLHPTRGGMRVGPRDLVIWSFLMASAHGAGLMALPFAMAVEAPAGGHAGHAAVQTAGVAGEQTAALLATLLHTVGYLAMTAVVAVLVYDKLGLRLLRRAWVNLDPFWGAALVVTGVVTALA